MQIGISIDNLHKSDYTPNMIPRKAEAIIHKLSKGFPVVAITGPRQSGKTTLAKASFPSKPYITLENPDMLELALDDPKGFLNNYRPKGAVLDEVQRAPQLLSYLQAIVDEDKEMGAFVLTGSQRFNLLAPTTPSPAGRVGLIELLPFSYEEIGNRVARLSHLNEWIYKGGYPPLYDRELDAQDWFAGYVMAYLERDIRAIKNVQDIHLFRLFVRMCAARTGQVLNLSSLANDCGITHNTARSWASILEASYIVFLLQPYYANLGKRLVKSPKLYFYDTGLACWLLGIKSAEQINTHSSRGALFENMVIADVMKGYFTIGKRAPFYYYRDSNGTEIDLIIENGQEVQTVEIKSGATLNSDYFKSLKKWDQLSKHTSAKTLVYSGDTQLTTHGINVLPWSNKQLLRPVS